MLVISAGRGGRAGLLVLAAEVDEVAFVPFELALATGLLLLPLCAALRSQGLGGEGFATEDILVVVFKCLEQKEPVLPEANCREAREVAKTTRRLEDMLYYHY